MDLNKVHDVWLNRERLADDPLGKVSALAVNCETESPHTAQLSLEETRSLLELNLDPSEAQWRLRALVEGEPIERLRFSANQLTGFDFDPRIIA